MARPTVVNETKVIECIKENPLIGYDELRAKCGGAYSTIRKIKKKYEASTAAAAATAPATAIAMTATMSSAVNAFALAMQNEIEAKYKVLNETLEKRAIEAEEAKKELEHQLEETEKEFEEETTARLADTVEINRLGSELVRIEATLNTERENNKKQLETQKAQHEADMKSLLNAFGDLKSALDKTNARQDDTTAK